MKRESYEERNRNDPVGWNRNRISDIQPPTRWSPFLTKPLTEKLNNEKTSQSLKPSNKRPNESHEKYFLVTTEFPSSKITMEKY